MTKLLSEDPGEADPFAALQSILKNRKGPKMLSAKLETANCTQLWWRK